LALEYFHGTYFEKIINVYTEEKRHANSIKITDKLSLEESDHSWAPAWLQLNFTNVENLKKNPAFVELAKAVNDAFNNNKVDGILRQKEEIEGLEVLD